MRPTRRWGATSIGSLAIGQEVGVTPIQLVTMVSTIANGGVFLPPHIVIASTPAMKGSEDLKPLAFHPGDALPDPLPDGSRRVISTMTAAQMRKMMEGIVLYGTGKGAALNGYSSAGKTGTAQKIDVATHTYSKTKYVASFAGFAPVNNPAISVTVIIDSPSAGGSYYGAAVSAPVFKEVAQQVLEYLGVPHDTEVKTAPQPPITDDADDVPNSGDLNELFADLNELPADDPLRNPVTPLRDAGNPAAPPVDSAAGPTSAPTPREDQLVVKQKPPAKIPEENAEMVQPLFAPVSQTSAKGGVVLDSGRKVAVPSFTGLGIRKVVEQAGGVGLGVQFIGNGVAREQAPLPGTMVPLGTTVIVRCTR